MHLFKISKTYNKRNHLNFRWIILSLAWLIYFSFGLIMSSFAPLITPIMNQINLTYTEVGIIGGAWQLIVIFCSYPFGLIVDRIGCWRSLVLGTIIISLSSILRASATNFLSLFIFVALFGFGGPFISIGLPKLVASWFNDDKKGIALGINISGGSIGSTLGLALTNSIVLPLVGRWEMVFASYGIVGLFIALLWMLFGKEVPRKEENYSKTIRVKDDVKRILSLVSVWIIVLIGVTNFMVDQGLKNWLPKILEVRGYTAVEAGVIASLLAASMIVGNLFFPHLSKYIGSNRRNLSIILLLLSFTVLALGISIGSLLIVEIFLIGFFLGGFMPLLQHILADTPNIRSEYMGVAIGLFFSIGEIGGFLGPFLIGFSKDLTNSFLPALFVLSAYSTIMFILSFNLEE